MVMAAVVGSMALAPEAVMARCVPCAFSGFCETILGEADRENSVDAKDRATVHPPRSTWASCSASAPQTATARRSAVTNRGTMRR
jgi:hypothetical protein